MPRISGPAPSPQPPPVILVHGFASSYEHNWVRTGWADTLANRGHQVIGLDLPGHGGNSAPGGAAAALAQLTELATGHAAVDLVGFSAGARICALAAAGGQVPVRRVVLAGLGDSLLHGGQQHGDRPGRDGGGDGDPDGSPAMSLTGPLDPADVRSGLFRRMAASAGNDPALGELPGRPGGRADRRGTGPGQLPGAGHHR